MPKTLLRFIYHFVKPYKGVAILFVTIALLAGLWGPLNTWLLKYIVDTSALASPRNVSFLIWPAVLLVLNFIVFDNVTWRSIGWLNRKYQPLIKTQILSETFSYVAHAPLSFFQERMSGRLASQLTILADNIERMLDNNVPMFLRAFSLLIFALIGMWSVDACFFLILMVWFILFFYISYITSKKLVPLSDKHAVCESINAGQFVDSLSNINNVRMFANSNFEVTRLSQFLLKTKTAYRKLKYHLASLHSIQGGLIAAMLAGMLFYLIRLYGQNQISIGDFVMVVGLSFEVGHMIWNTMGVFDEFNLAAGKCKQSLDALLLEYEMTDVADAKPIVVKKGRIQFQEASFNYKGEKRVFEGLSLDIKSFEKVGLVGFSGAGKSTFVNLILRFFDLQKGAILIDDQDISKVTRDSLRNQISMIPQDTTLFHRTILENIRYSRIDASDGEIIEAAKLANAHEFITQLPEGYGSYVGERGVKLSGGQRQRIAIARAMLKNTPILILDEATSALDSVTEQQIHDSLRTLMQNRTTIVVAHRLSTLLEMDRILVFEDGKVIEDGSHLKLLEKKGHYATMWHMQAGVSCRIMKEA